MDAIETVLDSLKLQSSVFCRMELSDSWGFAKDALLGAPFHIVLSGEAWLRLAGESKPTRLLQGDVVVLPRGDAHSLTGAADADCLPFKAVLAEHGLDAWSPGVRFKPVVVRLGTANEPATSLISGVFGFGNRQENPLLAALPALLHLRSKTVDTASSQPWLASTVAFLGSEVASGRPGSETVATRLADILFIQAVRSHLGTRETIDRGWLRGVADLRIGPALSAIHSRPERTWTVATLAEVAGMSRSGFAKRFQDLVGCTPVAFLTQWRMQNAAGRLKEGKVGLATLALSSGYTSEIAFSKAFRRWTGHKPSEYSQRTQAMVVDDMRSHDLG